MLDDRAVRGGYSLVTFESLGSTNEEAMDRARRGCAGLLWIRAESQTEGRGRLGRSWASPVGNLYTSLLLVDPCAPWQAPQMGFVAGLALARAVGSFAGADGSLRIKWPNDLLWQGAKLAGISVEGSQTAQGRFAVVIGIGVNCLSHPRGLLYPTSCLADFLSPVPTAQDLLRVLSGTMVESLALWDHGANFAGVREAWLGLALPPGSRLKVKMQGRDQEGTFLTIDALGRLMLATDVGPLTVEAADVFLTARV